MTTIPNPYNPTFYRNPLGSFNEQEAYVSVIAGTDALIMEDEINELQWVLSNQHAKALARIHSSGPFLMGNDVLSGGQLTLSPRDLLVGGYQLRMEGQTANSGNLIVPLPTAPTSGTRQDMVYLVLTLVTVSSTSTIRKYGYQYGDILGNDLVDTRIGAETTHRIQKQWQIYTAANTTSLTALGYSVASYDNNLYTKANAATVDGVEYAIPLYVVNRVAGGTDTLTDVAYYVHGYLRMGVPMGMAMLDANGFVMADEISGANLPPATTSTPGVIRAGHGLSVAPDGTLTVDATAFIAQSEVGAANGVAGLDANGKIPPTYLSASSLPVATSASLGAVKGSSSISVAADGTLWATAASIGAIATNRIGANNGVAGLDANGKIPASQLTPQNIPLASTTSLGIVQIGTGLNISNNGVLTTNPATVGAVASAAVGQPNGVAALNSAGQVPPGQVMKIGSTAPSSPGQAWQWFDTTVNRWKYYSGSAWVDPMKYV